MGAAEGNFNVQEVNGKLHIIMSIDAKDKNPESLTETITHELTLHGYRISDIIKAYEKGGIEAAKKYSQMMAEMKIMNHLIVIIKIIQVLINIIK
ncbi:hypothetical protein A4C53_RS11825 [Elizabethkingia anophelis]|uniref:hypothetical protein n=1 Tax=Elizabethkingia anophelis TaxID=1117645 RepID=UPI000442BE87|nr:hypothetical protein [Elizabethkingia anophelis]AMR42941.1 hypothetical protein A2T74_16955 [Elizabethkingia anophelis]AMX49583.1 hypothetical protein A4C56_16955 [Elizabethkingia anophelis]AMX53039.1 hypothetical protein A2T72_16950 [Elizabethkingia anophelis]AMX56433.1 hypothetical protein A2T59_16955 [Elizabethkingia anophelis]EGT4347244.1 hypothetical protein [Elizabethkingia anophelis]